MPVTCSEVCQSKHKHFWPPYPVHAPPDLAPQAILDDKLAAERSAVSALKAQAAAAKEALEAEQALVAKLKEEATVSAAASAQLLEIEQQVGYIDKGSQLCPV